MPALSVASAMMEAVTGTHSTVGSIWRLHHGGQELVRLTVAGADVPWAYAGDWVRADTCCGRIGSPLTMAFPDGGLVAEFMVHIHGDGTAGWRWYDAPFETAAGR
jgi:hypothetical protein